MKSHFNFAYLLSLAVFLILISLPLSCKKKTNSIETEESITSKQVVDSLNFYFEFKALSELEIDKKLFDTDLNTPKEKELPFKNSVFPVRKYTTGGNGFQFSYFNVENKKLTCTSFYKKENKESEIDFFFNIIFPGTPIENLNQNAFGITSRNHPDYLGQGVIKMSNLNINFVTFISKSGSSFAIIDSKIFNLENGNTIILKTKQDQSLRFMQIKHSRIAVNNISTFIQSLKDEKEILNFYKE